MAKSNAIIAPKNLLGNSVLGFFEEKVKEEAARNLSLDIDYDSFGYTDAYQLLRRRHEAACLDAILAKEHQRHREKQAEFRERWEKAASVMKQTDAAIAKFESHYQDSKDATERSVKVAAKQDEIRKVKEREIIKLVKQRELLRDVTEQTTERLERFEPVLEYLERTRDFSQGEFKSTRELLDRFDLIKDTRGMLTKMDHNGSEVVRKRQAHMDGLQGLKRNEVALLNNYIYELNEEYNNLTLYVNRLDEDLTHIKTTVANRAMNVGKLRMTTDNMYRSACKMLNIAPTISSLDTVRQLNYVQGALVEIKRLRKQITQVLKMVMMKHQRELKEKARVALLNRKKPAVPVPITQVRANADLFKLKLKDSIQSRSFTPRGTMMTGQATANLSARHANRFDTLPVGSRQGGLHTILSKRETFVGSSDQYLSPSHYSQRPRRMTLPAFPEPNKRQPIAFAQKDMFGNDDKTGKRLGLMTKKQRMLRATLGAATTTPVMNRNLNAVKAKYATRKTMNFRKGAK